MLTTICLIAIIGILFYNPSVIPDIKKRAKDWFEMLKGDINDIRKGE